MKNKRATTLHKNYLHNRAKYSNMVRNYLHCLPCGKISSLVYPNQLLRTVYTFIYLRQQNRSKLEIFKYVNGQTTIPKRNASWKCLEKGNVWFRPLCFFFNWHGKQNKHQKLLWTNIHRIICGLPKHCNLS